MREEIYGEKPQSYFTREQEIKITVRSFAARIVYEMESYFANTEGDCFCLGKFKEVIKKQLEKLEQK